MNIRPLRHVYVGRVTAAIVIGVAMFLSADLCRADAIVTLHDLIGPGQTFSVNENPGGPPDVLNIAISDAHWQQPGEVQLIDPLLPAISDIVQFFNDPNPPFFARVLFASDDEAGNLPPLQPLPVITVASEGAPVVVNWTALDPIGNPVVIQATIFSDSDPFSTVSDQIILRIVPEPGSLVLLAVGLIGLAVLGLRRRHIRK